MALQSACDHNTALDSSHKTYTHWFHHPHEHTYSTWFQKGMALYFLTIFILRVKLNTVFCSDAFRQIQSWNKNMYLFYKDQVTAALITFWRFAGFHFSFSLRDDKRLPVTVVYMDFGRFLNFLGSLNINYSVWSLLSNWPLSHLNAWSCVRK